MFIKERCRSNLYERVRVRTSGEDTKCLRSAWAICNSSTATLYLGTENSTVPKTLSPEHTPKVVSRSECAAHCYISHYRFSPFRGGDQATPHLMERHVMNSPQRKPFCCICLHESLLEDRDDVLFFHIDLVSAQRLEYGKHSKCVEGIQMGHANSQRHYNLYAQNRKVTKNCLQYCPPLLWYTEIKSLTCHGNSECLGAMSRSQFKYPGATGNISFPVSLQDLINSILKHPILHELLLGRMEEQGTEVGC